MMNKAISLLELLEGERDAVQEYNAASETISLLTEHGKNSTGLLLEYKQALRSAIDDIEHYRQEIKKYIEGLENF